jgi:hypothetical protein
MSETRNFALPLLEAAQAQKHVTVNEALVRVDALAAAIVISRSRALPPDDAGDGYLWIVPEGAGGAWSGRAGALALSDNQGWSFTTPRAGQRVWLSDEGEEARFDGLGWRAGASAIREGAASALRVATLDHAVGSGPASATAPAIPDKAVVFGVTARVIADLTGAGLTTWRLGVPEAPGRYGSGYATARGAFAQGLTSAPLAYFAPTPLLIEAETGSFDGGMVRLAVHFLEIAPPSP